MEGIILLNSGFYAWLILPLLIFLARVTDVSIGTIRLIFISFAANTFKELNVNVKI